MKHIPTVAGVLLGLLFLTFGLNFFLKFLEMPAPPKGSPPALFFSALAPTGYLAFIKILEIAGGIMVAIPMLRRIGLLILTPIVVNILCFHIFLTGGSTLTDPVVLVTTALTGVLLVSEYRALKILVK